MAFSMRFVAASYLAWGAQAETCTKGEVCDGGMEPEQADEAALLQTSKLGGAPDEYVVGMANPEYGGVNGGVMGGIARGLIQNDFDWEKLKTYGKPDCKKVCISKEGTCYPRKGDTNYWGPPCGQPPAQHRGYDGCFTNVPTQTCALCTKHQPYCCLLEDIPHCPWWMDLLQTSKLEGAPDGNMVGTTNPVYGGVNGGVMGGIVRGLIQNDFDWEKLKTYGKPDCKKVCISKEGTCYPRKGETNYWGPPCGQPPAQHRGYDGCFTNVPTQTCALCTKHQPYCCLLEDIPHCPWWM